MLKKLKHKLSGLLFLHSFFYLLVIFVFKLVLIALNGDAGLLPYLPYSMLPDMVFYGALFVALDLPLTLFRHFNRLKAYRIFSLFAGLVFLFVLLYHALVLKIYSLMGTLLNYGLVTQFNKLENFKSSMASELDGVVLLLMLAVIIIFALYVFLQIRNATQFKIFSLKTGTLALFFAVPAALVFSSLFIHRQNPKNLLFIDRNPVLEMLTSIKTDTADEETDNTSTIVVNNNPLFRSIVSEGKVRPALPVKRSKKPMNVVIFVLESTYQGYTGLYKEENEAITKNLNRLAGNALVLKNHYCQEPASLKARYSILTGRFSYKTRHWKKFAGKTEKDITIGEIMKQNGYQTAYITAGDIDLHYENLFIANRFDQTLERRDLQKRYPGLPNQDMGYDDRSIIRAFDDFLKTRDKKFLAVLTPMLPHHPHNVPDKQFEIYPNKKIKDRYKNSLYFEDHIIGGVYGLLEKYGLADDTLFVIVSDHGEAFWQHKGNYGHAIHLYEENIRTVGMIINPVLFKSRIDYDGISNNIDLVPTILDLAGIEPKTSFDGSSLVRQESERLSFSYTSYGNFFYGIRDGRYKYIYNNNYGTEELFDLEADPEEQKNIAETNKALTGKFKSRVMEFQKYLK